jgi:hypothetical protein
MFKQKNQEMRLQCKMGLGCNSKQRCEQCLLQFGSLVHQEIPLKYQQILLKSNISRFSVVISDGMSIDEIKNMNRNLDKYFKVQFDRICANQSTFLPPTQIIINDELQSIKNLVKPLHHLFVYTNVKCDLSILISIHCHIWVILDYPNSVLDSTFAGAPNIVVISLSNARSENTHPLAICFSEVRRETLQQLLKRLQTDVAGYNPNIHSFKPSSTFFGFE